MPSHDVADRKLPTDAIPRDRVHGDRSGEESVRYWVCLFVCVCVCVCVYDPLTHAFCRYRLCCRCRDATPLHDDDDGGCRSQGHVNLLDPRLSSRSAAHSVHEFVSLDESCGVRSLAWCQHILAVGGGKGRVGFYDLRAQRYLDLRGERVVEQEEEEQALDASSSSSSSSPSAVTASRQRPKWTTITRASSSSFSSSGSSALSASLPTTATTTAVVSPFDDDVDDDPLSSSYGSYGSYGRGQGHGQGHPRTNNRVVHSSSIASSSLSSVWSSWSSSSSIATANGYSSPRRSAFYTRSAMGEGKYFLQSGKGWLVSESAAVTAVNRMLLTASIHPSIYPSIHPYILSCIHSDTIATGPSLQDAFPGTADSQCYLHSPV